MTYSANEIAVREHHALGMTDTQIRNALGLGKATVWDIRKRLGLPINPAWPKRKPPKPAKHIDREYLAREFDETMKALQAHGDHAGVRRNVKRVALELDANYDHLMRIYTHEMGLITLMPTKRYTEEQYAEARRLLDDHGLSYMEVGRQTGISWDMLSEKFPGRGLSASEAATVRWVNKRMREMGI